MDEERSFQLAHEATNVAVQIAFKAQLALAGRVVAMLVGKGILDADEGQQILLQAASDLEAANIPGFTPAVGVHIGNLRRLALGLSQPAEMT